MAHFSQYEFAKKSSNVLVNAVKLYFYNFCFFHTIIFTWITYIRWILQNTIIVNYDFSYLQTDLKDLENLKTFKVLIQQMNIGQTFPLIIFLTLFYIIKNVPFLEI